MKYFEITPGKIQSVAPEISGQTLSMFVDHILDRVCCFVEEITVYALQSQMPTGITITEIPPSVRKATFPERFQLTFIDGGRPIWKITHHACRFEEA